jgi:outer membrane protein assembly factor BamB
VFVAVENGLVYAFNQSSGSKKWDFATPDMIWAGSLLAANGIVYIGSRGGDFFALDADSGKVLWSKDFNIDVVEPPLLQNGNLYISTTYVWSFNDRNFEGKAKLIVLDATSGEEKWAFESGNYILAPPFVDSESVYLGGNWWGPEIDEGGNTRVYSLDLQSCEAGSCEVKWSHESHQGFPKTIYVVNGVLSYLGYRDEIFGLDASTGELLWRSPTPNWVASYSFLDNLLFYGSANNVVLAVDGETGKDVWMFETGGRYFNYIWGSPYLVDTTLYFYTLGDYRISAIDSMTGKLLWYGDSGIESTSSAPTVTGNTVGSIIFMGSWDGNLSAFQMN